MRFTLVLATLSGGAFAARPFLNEPDTGIDQVLGTIADGTLTNLTNIKGLPDFENGAGGEWSYRNNLEAFQRYRFRPRTMVDITNVENTLNTTILGHNFSAPFFISPCGRAGYAHADGEINLVNGAANGKILYIASQHGTKTIEEIHAAKAEGQVVFQQMYLDRNLTEAQELFRRSEKAGADALVYTIDSPADGNRIRAARFDVTSSDSGWTYITWDHYNNLRNLTKLPIILKGIGSVEDVKLAVKHNVPAVILGNHGARQLDGAPSPIEIALEIYQEDPSLFQKIEILADGGVRYGGDVLKLLALGVKAVGLGRSFMYANTYGTEGIERAIKILKHEIAIDAGNLGVGDLSKIDISYVKWEPSQWLS